MEMTTEQKTAITEVTRPTIKTVTNKTITKAELNDIDLSGKTFGKCNLIDVNFNGCNLSNVNFNGCDLSGSDFSYCDLDGAIFEGCILDNVNFDYHGGKVNIKSCFKDNGLIVNHCFLSTGKFYYSAFKTEKSGKVYHFSNSKGKDKLLTAGVKGVEYSIYYLLSSV